MLNKPRMKIAIQHFAARLPIEHIVSDYAGKWN
jgi:hypothetical protein